jgi:MFS transporter, FHS family, L-fucose permease
LDNLPEVSEEQDDAILSKTNKTNKTSIFDFPHLILGALAIFFYVGAEVITIDTLINYGKDLGFGENKAKIFGTYGLWAMLVGYICGIILIPKFISQSLWLYISAVIGIVFTLVAVYMTSGFNSILCIAVLGFANAVMWPAIWPLAIDGLGRFTKMGSALLIMGISGGALLPMLYGQIADYYHSTQMAYLLLIPCYLYILYYALSGHKVGKS